MKRRAASYRFGVSWIALNDSAAEDRYDEEAVSGFVSTLLLADLFGKEADDVARDIVRYRRKEDAEK